VSGRGPGVPAAELSNIFRSFYRVADADRQSGGIGLGLAIAERVARVTGGVSARKTAPAAGSQSS
jgi:signal transduction histidine kinase